MNFVVSCVYDRHVAKYVDVTRILRGDLDASRRKARTWERMSFIKGRQEALQAREQRGWSLQRMRWSRRRRRRIGMGDEVRLDWVGLDWYGLDLDSRWIV